MPVDPYDGYVGKFGSNSGGVMPIDSDDGYGIKFVTGYDDLIMINAHSILFSFRPMWFWFGHDIFTMSR